MDILYGINGTGDGHTSRGRALAPRLTAKDDLSLSYLFSGRAAKYYKNMDAFPDFTTRDGLVIKQSQGGIDFFDSAKEMICGQHSLKKLFKDAANLPVHDYDLIITDFEPVTSLAARWRKAPHLGIAHQYAFHHSLPAGINPWQLAMVTQAYSPVKNSFGLHWNDFGQNILPPIFDAPIADAPEKGMILVYLGHEDLNDVVSLLSPLAHGYEFHIYHQDIQSFDATSHKGLVLKPKSPVTFKQDMARCEGLITNAGFVAPSEMIHLGRKLLVKPLEGQIEQVSNMRALEYLGYGRGMARLDGGIIADWLQEKKAAKVCFPNVAAALADWIAQGDWDNQGALKHELWQQTEIHHRLK
tara:strand:+ start:122117 stop:123184 length:1068 start_codon:yes stop_codon:yes gene_type:complete